MRVLIADDNGFHRAGLKRTLIDWGHDVVDVEDNDTAIEVLRAADPPQLAIFECMRPASDSLQVCREIRKNHKDPYVYLMVLAANGDQESLVRGLEAGIDDYITRPLNPLELKARIHRARRILDLLEELNSIRRTLTIEATHDSLTGLLNRAETLRLLEKELTRAQREDRPLGILLVDVDKFKQINDNHGHLAGDAVLRSVGRRLCSSARIYDSIGRYGGDEFLLVLPGCSPTNARIVAERHRSKIAAKPVRSGGTSIGFAVSIGVAAGSCKHVESATSLFRAADAALYRAKEQGRNCVEVQAIPEPTDNEMILEHWEVS